MPDARRWTRLQAREATSSAIPNSKAGQRAVAPVTETEQPSKKRGRPKSTAGRKQRSTTSASEISTTAPEPSKSQESERNPPRTPTAKRRKTNGAAAPTASPSMPPPFTPTPSAIGLMTSSPVTTDVLPRAPRLAEPHATNAPLAAPGGSHVLASSSDVPESSEVAPAEDAGTTLRPATTTENLLEKACAHLIKVDPRFQTVIEKHPCRIFSPEGLREEVDPFKSLVRGILAQQVSGAAAKSIVNRFTGLFTPPPNDPPTKSFFPTPAQVAIADLALLRTAGLSQRKAEYVSGLAQKFAAGELSAPMLVGASDAEVLEKLTAVRGLGQWSVQMFACFALKRMDVFSTGDLGVQRGMAAWLGKDVAKLKGKGGKWKYLSEREMLEHSAPFTPYRSLFMWYMWRIEDVNLDAIQGG